MINVIILDDHQLFIDGLVNSFISDSEINIIGFANDGTTGLKLIGLQKPDVVILDIDFTKTNESGLDILKEIRKTNSSLKILILTGYCDRSLIENLQKEGSNGYLLKNVDFEQLHQTIIDIYNGKYVFKYDIFSSKKGFSPVPILSDRAIEILKLLSQGLIVKEIASQLQIAETTVTDHIERTKRKLSAKNNVELIFMASKNRLI